MKKLYLNVDNLHTLAIYHIPSKNKNALPLIVVHGGPGGGHSRKYISFLLKDGIDIDVVLFDQRGCGKSTPRNAIIQNTTFDLVHDINKVRAYIQKNTSHTKWTKPCIFGASFGAVLSILYAATYPQHTHTVVAHGFTELSPFFSKSLRKTAPIIWRSWLMTVTPTSYQKPTRKFYTEYLNQLQYGSPSKKEHAVNTWTALESKSTLYYKKPIKTNKKASYNKKKTLALMECHYAKNNSFMPDGVPLQTLAKQIGTIPVYITHGQHDKICPIRSAFKLHKTLQNSYFISIPYSGHALLETNTKSILLYIINTICKTYKLYTSSTNETN